MIIGLCHNGAIKVLGAGYGRRADLMGNGTQLKDSRNRSLMKATSARASWFGSGRAKGTGTSNSGANVWLGAALAKSPGLSFAEGNPIRRRMREFREQGGLESLGNYGAAARPRLDLDQARRR
jgi:hypothetical protein